MVAKSKIVEISRKVPSDLNDPLETDAEFNPNEGEIRAIRGSDDASHDQELGFASNNSDSYWEEESEQPKFSRLTIFGAVLGLLIFVGWSGYFLWAYLPEILKFPAPDRVVQLVGLWAVPTLLLAIGWLLAMRNSRSEALRFGHVAQLLRNESVALEERMQSINGEIALARSFLAENARELDSVGRQSAQRLTEAAQQLGSALRDADEKAHILANVSSAAITNLDQLRIHLPVVTSAAKDVTNQIGTAGRAAQQQIEAIIPVLDNMGQTAKGSLDQIEQMHIATKNATASIGIVAQDSAATLNVATGQAAQQYREIKASVLAFTSEIEDRLITSSKGLNAELGAGIDSLSSRLILLQSDLDAQAQSSTERLDERVSALQSVLTEAGTAATTYDAQLSQTIAKLETSISACSERITGFNEDATDRMANLAFAITALSDSSGKLNDSLSLNEVQTTSILREAEKLMLALDNVSREMDDGLPVAFNRMQAHFSETQSAFERIVQDATQVEHHTVTLCKGLGVLENSVQTQRDSLEHLLNDSGLQLSQRQSQIEALASTVTSTRGLIDELAQSAGDDVISALSKIRDTTNDVVVGSRAILTREMGSIASTLSEQNKQLLDEAVDRQVASLNEAMQLAIEKNISLSEDAASRVSQQLLQLDEMTASLEKRVAEAQEQFGGLDDEGFARRMALLTESLNSAAIDVAKILSNEVTDTAWAAYLKGDRGVFTRRAVKLLDSNESKIIASNYEEDREFREHVNRYIHDFEAMMRVLLSTRDGNTIGVTILSSDVGKLYVALAQAIDRLRN